jgi:uncharacterized protein YydD (DUF2326 family)
MQISRVYSNLPRLFTPIDFHCRDDSDHLNVVYGEVRHPTDQKRDSHNLGKTTLLHLIDFLLLKGMSPDQFVAKHSDRFAEFVFFIEVALNAGDYVTVRRSAATPNRIAMTRHSEGRQDFVEEPEDVWDHPDLSRDDAVKLLDSWLDLKMLKPYDYRKAITYFLRAQGDYNDELQLQKFNLGKDRDWKPFVAHLFGFNETSLQRKYELDDQIEQLRKQLAERQAEVKFSENELPELTARIGVLDRQVDEVEAAIDAFRFDAEERRILRDLVESIETEISSLNDRLYNIRYDISQITTALGHKDKFDLKQVEEIFAEANLYFPERLHKEYDDLVAFNKKITQERNAALRTRLRELTKEGEELAGQKEALDKRRASQLSILRGTDTFEKFKELQKKLSQDRAQLVYLEEQRKKLEEVAGIARQVREADRDRGRVIDEMKTMVIKPTVIYERFSSTFNNYCQRVLNHDGIFFFKINNNNNFDYSIGLSLPGQAGTPSSQSEGTSYKKLICALFDLALLKVYEACLSGCHPTPPYLALGFRS